MVLLDMYSSNLTVLEEWAEVTVLCDSGGSYCTSSLFPPVNLLISQYHSIPLSVPCIRAPEGFQWGSLI